MQSPMLYLLLIILPFLISFIIGALGHGPLSHSWEAFLREGGPQYSVFEVKNTLVFGQIPKRLKETMHAQNENTLFTFLWFFSMKK